MAYLAFSVPSNTAFLLLYSLTLPQGDSSGLYLPCFRVSQPLWCRVDWWSISQASIFEIASFYSVPSLKLHHTKVARSRYGHLSQRGMCFQYFSSLTFQQNLCFVLARGFSPAPALCLLLLLWDGFLQPGMPCAVFKEKGLSLQETWRWQWKRSMELCACGESCWSLPNVAHSSLGILSHLLPSPRFVIWLYFNAHILCAVL